MHNQPPNNILEVFCSEFMPGINEDFDSVMGTDEICEAICKQNGNVYPATEIVSHLKEQGFKFKVIDGTMFWLLKEV
jgi:hypothetical protein